MVTMWPTAVAGPRLILYVFVAGTSSLIDIRSGFNTSGASAEVLEGVI
jgi:hypothetical protein